MQFGLDSFATTFSKEAVATPHDASVTLQHLVERMVLSERVGLDFFGIGEHYRADFLDSCPPVILAAAASRTERLRLTSAVTVLSAADPVRVYQQFATLDLLSGGRAEIVVGRGSFVESFPLFGLKFDDYDSLFAEKLELLLEIRANEKVTWSGRHRPALKDQGVYPRALQQPLPVWVGVGGSPESVVRAGALGLPLMVAIIGGETRRFRPLVDLYRQAGLEAGHAPETLKVGVHALGYVAETTEQAVEEFYPGYARTFTKIGEERGWPPVTRRAFEAQRGTHGALLVGSPDEVAAKILNHSQALGGIDRLSLQMDVASLPHERLSRAIELFGTQVAPNVRAGLAA